MSVHTWVVSQWVYCVWVGMSQSECWREFSHFHCLPTLHIGIHFNFSFAVYNCVLLLRLHTHTMHLHTCTHTHSHAHTHTHMHTHTCTHTHTHTLLPGPPPPHGCWWSWTWSAAHGSCCMPCTLTVSLRDRRKRWLLSCWYVGSCRCHCVCVCVCEQVQLSISHVLQNSLTCLRRQTNRLTLTLKGQLSAHPNPNPNPYPNPYPNPDSDPTLMCAWPVFWSWWSAQAYHDDVIMSHVNHMTPLY